MTGSSRAGLVDELQPHALPAHIWWEHGSNIADGLGCQRLADAASFALKSVRRHGDELFSRLSRDASAG